MRRWASLVVVLVLGVVAAFGAGTAQAKLDPSFGDGGVLHLSPPVPDGWASQAILAVASGEEGRIFAVDRQFQRCTTGSCEPTLGDYTFNYLADGTLNAPFAGSRGYRIPPGGKVTEPLVAVSSSGLAIVAHVMPVSAEPPGSILLQRLTAAGGRDPGFGSGGTTSFHCDCGYENVQLLAGPQSSTFVMVNEEFDTKSGAAGEVTVFKLNGAGRAAKKYGSGGHMNVRIPGQGTLEYAALAPGGATYFGGIGKSTRTYQGALTKVSAGGRVAGGYTRAATKALKRLLAIKGEGVRVTAAVPETDGTLALFGSAGSAGGFELKLRAGGALETKFGKNGLRRLGRRIVGAIAGDNGAAMALTAGSSPRVLRILANGSPDPSFGKSGEELPGLTGRPILQRAGRGKVDVVDLGLRECRQVCQVSPKVYRFLEN